MSFLDDVSRALDAATTCYGQVRDAQRLEESLREAGRTGPSDAVEAALDAATNCYGEVVDESVLADHLDDAGWS